MSPTLVQMTPERAAALGLPPCRFALDTTGAGLAETPTPGHYAHLVGAPGGTLLLDLLPCDARDEAALARWFQARLAGPIEGVSPVGSVPFAGAGRPVITAVTGSGYARDLWCVVLVHDPVHAPWGLAIVAAVCIGAYGRAELATLLGSPFVGGALATFALGPTPAPRRAPPVPLPANPPPVVAPPPPVAAPPSAAAWALPPTLYLEEVDAQPPAHHRARDGATLGRAARNDIRLRAPSVSREHATVACHGDTWEIRPRADTDASLNGARLQRPAALHDGDVLTLGQQTLKVTLRAPAEVLPPPALVAAFAARSWPAPPAPSSVAGRLLDLGGLRFATHADAPRLEGGRFPADAGPAWADARDHLVVQIDEPDGPSPRCQYLLAAPNIDVALVAPLDAGVLAALRALLTAIHHAARRRVLSPYDVIHFECDHPDGRARWRTHHNVVGGASLLDALADAAAHVSAH